MTTPGTFRWIGLTRVSGATQANDGDGLETQSDAIKRWVAARGDKLVDICSDVATSTLEAVDKRFGLATALEMLDDGSADGLVVQKLDRLGRGTVQELLLWRITSLGCEVASCTPGEQDTINDRDDPVRILTRQILAAFSEYERRMIVARTRAGWLRKKAAGGYVGGQVGYGWERDGHGGLREVPGEMAVIGVCRTMREMGATLATIGEYMMAAGLRLRSAKSKRFSPQVVKEVIERANAKDYPPPLPLNNLAKAFIDLPLDQMAV